MLRVDLLDKLSIVEPVLAKANLIPILTHFWFTGSHVMAFDGQVAISTPLKTSFKGAVPGDILLSLLRNSKAKTIELEPQKDEMQIKAASSRLKLALLPDDQFVFDMPAPKGDKTKLKVKTGDLLGALESCMRSVGVDASIPDQLGVTLIPDGLTLGLFATNNSTLSQADVKLSAPAPFKGRVILSTLFCEQMIRLAKGSQQTTLEINGEYALFQLGQSTRLFGNLVESDRPVDFKAAIKHHFPDSNKTKLSPIPSKFKLILERAIIITDAGVDQGATTITVKDGKMRFLSKSSRGEVSDIMQIENHPDVLLRVEAKLIKNGYGFFTDMLMTEACVVMAKGSHKYLVSTIGG